LDVQELTINYREEKEVRKKGSGKVLSELDAHRRIAEKNLKVSLTHPTILNFFRQYVEESGPENGSNLLAFYLASVNVRFLSKTVEAHEILAPVQELIDKFIAIGAPQAVSLNTRYRSMILMNADSPTKIVFALEGIRMAQYEIFFVMQETMWLPFCESEQYEKMSRRKEVSVSAQTGVCC